MRTRGRGVAGMVVHHSRVFPGLITTYTGGAYKPGEVGKKRAGFFHYGDYSTAGRGI